MSTDEDPGQDALPGLDEIAVLAERFTDFAETVARHLPLYRYLCKRAAADHEVVGRLLLGPPEQRVPTLLLAAVHDYLLSGEPDPLAAWYGSLTDPVRPIGEGVDDPWPHFRRLALENNHVARRLRTAATQTNEVGRCVALLPALAQIAEHAPGAPDDGVRPLGLVEIGASGGLNLLFDHYGYCYRADGTSLAGEPVEVNPGAFVTLECEVRGTVWPPIPSTFPTVASRIGLDLNPVDLSDRADARWLVACQWPDQPDRLHRARAAVALAHGDHAEVLAGDAVDDVAPLIERVGEHALPVVISTWTLTYLDPTRQAELLAVVDGVGAERDLTMVLAENPSLIPALDVPPRPDGIIDDRPTVLIRLDWRDGERTATRLADMHPHGTWLEWLDA